MRKAVISGFTQSSVAVNFVAARPKVPLLFIMNDADEAGYLYQDFKNLGCEEVMFLPSSYKRAVKFGQRDASSEIMRTEVLTHPTGLIITYPAALAELVPSRHTVDEHVLALQRGGVVEIQALMQQLRDLRFHEVDYVYEPGQFAVRGSIVDIYSYSSEQPYRLDFFDDEIDTIRTFNIETQLSESMLDAVTIVPEIAKSAEEKVPFLALLPDDTVIVTKDMQYVIGAIDYIYKDGFSKQALSDRLTGATEQEKEEIMRELTASLNLCKASVFEKAAERMKQLSVHSSQFKSKTSKDEGNHNSELRTDNCELRTVTRSDEPLRTNCELLKGALHEGFIDDVTKTVLFTDHQIFERFHKYQLKGQEARRGKMALTMKELQEMEPGDFIVHVDFGIGKFAGLVRVPTITKQPDGTMLKGYQEVIRIVYQRNDIVDVSIHSLYKISKYRRADSGEPPKLSTLGTGAWERIKERAKTRIKDIARDLIKLYAKRRHEKGFAFSPDTYMQAQLEGSFLYEDTPDQLKATQEVKHDMELARPMDRLVCGDVGFGKTEVAIRAAFKAAVDGKQVAVLVPTTVLAFQHYQTFTKRLSGHSRVRNSRLSAARAPNISSCLQPSACGLW